jgi:ABC-type multidrug transport system permease subunit
MNTLLFGFRSVAAKEFLHIRRDPTTLVMALMVPLLQLVLFGYALNFDVRHIETVVVDLDKSQASREYIQRVQNTQYLDVVGYLSSPDLVEQALRRSDAHVGIIIPPDFGRRYGTSVAPTVHILVDGSDSQAATAALSAFAPPRGPSGPIGVDPRVNVLFNPDIRTQVFTIPALVCVLMQLITVMLTSFSLVREREQGTLEQLMVSPIGRLGLMLGKVAPYSVLALAELVCVLLLGCLVFDVPFVGNFFLLIVLAVPYIIAALAMGLFISTVAQNQAQAMQMSGLVTLPSVLLSGYIAPRETLPPVLYWLGDLFPVTHFIQISRGIVVRGATFEDVFPSVLWLILLATALIAASTARFRKSLA